MSIPHLITERSLTFVVDAKPYQVDRSADQYGEIVAELNKGDRADGATLIELADKSRKILAQVQATVEASASPKAVQYLTKGIIAVSREGVTFNGEPIHNALADRLMMVLNDGLNLGPWVRFAENVYQNPAEYSREELMLWLEKSDLPITSDGCFLAYKIVGEDFKDLYKGQFDNSPGQLVSLPGRQSVDPTRAHTCSYGLHFCSKDYLPHYGTRPGRKIVLVKVNPADVVSIPSDYSNAKGRTWRYEVMEEVPEVEIAGKAWGPVANSFSSDYEDDPETEEYWDGYDDGEYDDEDPEITAAELERQYRSELDDLNILQLRSLAAAEKAGNAQWVWREASAPALRDWIAQRKAARAAS